MKILFLVFFLFYSQFIPFARSGETDIRLSSDSWRGHAHEAALGEVLSLAARKTGVDIYVDEAVEEESISFDLSGEPDTEKALRQMIGSFNHAALYDKNPKTGALTLRKFWIYPRSGKTGRYRTYPGAEDASPPQIPNPAAPHYGVSPKASARRSLSPGDIIKSRPSLQKNAFGAPARPSLNKRRRPDYRKTREDLAKAFLKHQRVKKQSQTRRIINIRNEARKRFERDAYIQQTKRQNQMDSTINQRRRSYGKNQNNP